MNSPSQFEHIQEVFGKTKEEKETMIILAKQQDPLTLAKQFIKKQPIYYDKSKIWWVWKQNKWNITDETEIINTIRKIYDIIGLVQGNFKSQLLEALKLEGREYQPKTAPTEWIQFGNTVYDLKKDTTFKATPEYFLTNVCPYTPSKEVSTITIDSLFTQWVGKKYVQTLYEIIAYCLLRDYPLHRIFFLVGRGRNGKGTFFNLLNKFIGVENIASTELDLLMKNRFESAKLYKKLVAQMSETNTTELSQTSMLKKLSGNDLIGYEFKNKDPFDAKNYAKILISTNSLPTTKDKTDGFYRRMQIIKFENQFSEKTDVLSKIPEEEYHNLARRCINVLKELLIKREFTNEGTVEERAKKYEEESNPLDRFISENCKEHPDNYVAKFEFKEKLITWLKNNGYRIMNDNEIGRLMKEKYEDKKMSFINEVGETKWWSAWLGLSFINKSRISRISRISTLSHSNFPCKETKLNRVEKVEKVEISSKNSSNSRERLVADNSKRLSNQSVSDQPLRIPEERVISDDEIVEHISCLGGDKKPVPLTDCLIDGVCEERINSLVAKGYLYKPTPHEVQINA